MPVGAVHGTCSLVILHTSEARSFCNIQRRILETLCQQIKRDIDRYYGQGDPCDTPQYVSAIVQGPCIEPLSIDIGGRADSTVPAQSTYPLVSCRKQRSGQL